MPFPSKADNNVPFTGTRPRYSLVNTTATWCYHHMAAGASLSGEAPRTATTDEAATDPAVIGGKAEYKNLTKGGLFTIQAHAKKTLVVDAVTNPGNATITLVDLSDHAHSRAIPTTPFKVSAGEVIKATGGAAGGYVGILYRIDGEEIW
jgi:hypothetical protein